MSSRIRLNVVVEVEYSGDETEAIFDATSLIEDRRADYMGPVESIYVESWEVDG